MVDADVELIDYCVIMLSYVQAAVRCKYRTQWIIVIIQNGERR